MTWRFNEIKDQLEVNMTTKRFRHTLGVVEVAEQLAMFHGVDQSHARMAALLHDVAKEQNMALTKETLMVKEEIGYLNHSDKVWHAPVGAYLAKERFDILEVDVLNAIRYHTTGRPAMTPLEKVIFVADYMEPNRTHKGSIKVRELWKNLDLAVYEILKQKIEKVKALDKDMHPDTLAAYDYYETVVNQKGFKR